MSDPARHPAWVRAHAAAEIASHRSSRPAAVAGGGSGPYERLDLALYSPLCLALGAGTTAVVRAQPL